MFVALTETQDAIGDDALHVDRFGLSIGPVSVGLPFSCTADDVYRRYLDLLRVLRRGPATTLVASPADLAALATATASDCEFVARRLRALQAS